MQLDGEEEATAAICKEAVGLSFPSMEMMVLKGGPALKEDNSAATAAAAAAEVVKVSTAILNERSSMEPSSRLSPSNPKDSSVALNQEEQLEHTKSEMGEVREENERLKMILSQIVKDYHFLQKKYHDFLHQDHHQTSGNPYNVEIASGDDAENNNNDLVEGGEEPEELVSLTLGTSSSSSSLGQKKPEEINTTIIKRSSSEKERGGGDDGDDLSLGLDLKLEGFRKNPNNNETVSPENSSEEAKELDEPGEPWPPSKILKSLSAGGDEASEQPQVKKARVSVRARCDAPTMNDGCQWRKYGQKIAKGNPCPRAYYRCTVATGCPVRKQVQRCAEDMSILITTYEGTHNHPLPVSATAMASTTAAAASMLMSGSSSSSSSPPQPPVGLLSAGNTTLNGLHFGLFGAGPGGGSSSRPRQPFLPIPSISSTPSFPTITLDLTSPPPSTSSQFSRSFPRYSSASFNFSSPSETAGAPSPATSSWGSGFLTYGYGRSSGVGSLSLGGNGSGGGGRPSQDLYPYILQKAAAIPRAAARTTPLTDTIAKAITADPGFQSAVAAAITSYVGGGAGNGVQGHVLNLKPQGEPFPAASTGVSGCGSSYLNRSTGSSGSSHQASRLFLQPPLALPDSKSGSADQNAESMN